MQTNFNEVIINVIIKEHFSSLEFEVKFAVGPSVKPGLGYELTTGAFSRKNKIIQASLNSFSTSSVPEEKAAL